MAQAQIEGPKVDGINIAETAAESKVFTFELLDKEAIKKDQDGIRTILTGLDDRVHANALQCLAHCAKHRDTSLFRRLIMDICDENTGYRRAGLIQWMRVFSPMELKGKDINLSGVLTAGAKAALIEKFPAIDKTVLIVGEERPFLLFEASKTKLWEVSREVAIVKPAFRDTLMAPINTAAKNFRAALDNTKDGKPIDPSKPFFNGTHADKVVDFFDAIEKLQKELPKDPTRDVWLAQEALRKALGDDQAAKDAVKAAVC